MRLTIIISILVVILGIGFLAFSYFAPLPETTVPDVVGLNESEAVQRLERMSLSAKVDSRNSQSTIVTGQRPEAGKTVKVGRIIMIDIGKSGVENSIPSLVVVNPSLTSESKPSSEVKIEVIKEGDKK